MASRTGLNLSGLLVPLAAIAAWQLLKSTALLPYEYLPSPLDVLAALVVLIQTGELAADLGHTLGVALLVAGITLTLGGILGLAIGLMPAVRRYTMTSIDFLRTIPAVALVPVAVLTLGPAATTELILAVYAALWPIVLNTAGGVAAVHPRQYDVARILHFPSMTTVRKIVIPAAVPAWLVGARLAAVIGLLVAIVAEMIMYPRGLGGGLIESLNALAPARMWAPSLISGVAVVALIVSWPILLNAETAMRSIPAVRLEMSRTMGLSPVQRWGKVVLPSLAPGIMLGVRVASSMALIITLLVDILGAGAGIGRLLVESQQRFDASAAWGLLFIIGTFGYLTSVFLMWAEQRVAIPAEPDRPGNRPPARTG
jgi:ABC-type nitrate/sulfonate/bicarbonate transport system permease component